MPENPEVNRVQRVASEDPGGPRPELESPEDLEPNVVRRHLQAGLKGLHEVADHFR